VVHEWPSYHCVQTPFVYISNDRERRNDGESCTIYLFEVSKIGRPYLPGARSSLQSPGSKTKYGSMTSWYMSGRPTTAYGRPSYIYKTIANIEMTANRVPFTSSKCRKSAAKHCPRPALASSLRGENKIPLDDIVVHEWPSYHCVHTLFIYIQNDRERRNDGESCTIYLYEESKIGRPYLPEPRSSLQPPGSKSKYP